MSTIGSVEVPGTEYPDRTIYTDHGLFYVPFIADDGRVGYRVGYAVKGDVDERASWETYVYLNPSSSIDVPGTGDVFVYAGVDNDPDADASVVFIPMDDAAFGADPERVVGECERCGENVHASEDYLVGEEARGGVQHEKCYDDD